MSRQRAISPMDYILHGVYFFFFGMVKYVPSPIGDVLRFLVTWPFMRKLGRVRMYEGVTIWYPYRVSIGTNTTLNEWVYISGYGGVAIGSGVRIGHRTSILSSDHLFLDKGIAVRDQGLVEKPVDIGDDVYIGCNVTIMGGVSIGQGAVIGAGAVVTKDVEPMSIVAGVPAMKVSMRQ